MPEQSFPYDRIMLIGDTGGGKTAQLLTLPNRSKIFGHCFSPNGPGTLENDLNYRLFIREFLGSDLSTRSIQRKGSRYTDDVSNLPDGPQLYLTWADELLGLDIDYFKQLDYFFIDDFTVLVDEIRERTVFLQELVGREDARTDYNLAGDTTSALVKTLNSLPCHLIVTVHTRFKKDDDTHKQFNRLWLPGSARLILPRFFNCIWRCYYEPTQGYGMQTVADPLFPMIRTPRRYSDRDKVPEWMDVTIDWKEDPIGQGIGSFLRRGGRANA